MSFPSMVNNGPSFSTASLVFPFLWLCNDCHFYWGMISFLISNNIEQYFISFILEFFARICSPILIISFPNTLDFVFFCIQNSNLLLICSQDFLASCKLSFSWFFPFLFIIVLLLIIHKLSTIYDAQSSASVCACACVCGKWGIKFLAVEEKKLLGFK